MATRSSAKLSNFFTFSGKAEKSATTPFLSSSVFALNKNNNSEESQLEDGDRVNLHVEMDCAEIPQKFSQHVQACLEATTNNQSPNRLQWT